MSRHRREPSGSQLGVPRSRRRQPEMAGPYILGKLLGRGTSGKVKAAVHKDTGLQVAIKIIKKEYVQKHKNKIAREIAVMRLIEHPHVMKLYDVFETSKHYFLVLERIKGGELFDYIVKKGKLQKREALRLLSQCVQGLEFMHTHSICHRDLKPENLLLDENYNIKIADFGMAQVIPDGGVLGTFCGSPHYGAPEVVSGIKYDGRVSDVWSLGVVFYALVTGMLPFDHKNIGDLLKLVKRGRYIIPDGVDPQVKDLLRKMLEIDVRKRIKTTQIKYHPVFYGRNNINLYFPAEPQRSPALEMMQTNPITCDEDIDDSIIDDLEGLGWGTPDSIRSKLLENRTDSLHNLEYVFYQLLASRNAARQEEFRKYNMDMEQKIDDAPLSPHVVSLMEPVTPNSPTAAYNAARASHQSARASTPQSTGRRRRSERRSSPRAEPSSSPRRPVEGVELKMPPHESKRSQPEQKAEPIAVSVNPPSDAGHDEAPAQAESSGAAIETKAPATETKRRRPRNLHISTTPENSVPVETERTPRFHRLRFRAAENGPEAPSAPITPTAKRSWFKNLFKRRPSVDIVSGQQAKKGASGMYSGQQPAELRAMAQGVLEQMGISMKLSGASDYELKCEALCYLNTHFRIIVMNKQGSTVYEPTEDEKKEGQRFTTPNVPRSPNGGANADPTKPQIVKFSIDISREPKDRVSCINFNHRSGNLLVYRGLYNEITNKMEL